MDIWIIREGEKIGPIHDFDVRRKINDGELSEETPAWHEGLDAWKSLVEIDLFRREFDLRSEPVSEPVTEETAPPRSSTTPPPLPGKTFYGRRFWARWLDLSLYSGVWWLGMWIAGQDIGAALSNPWIMFLKYVPWFALEAVLLHRFGTTPGKWILGLQVVNLDQSRLDLAQSTRRSLRVLFTGIGFGWDLLAIFCQAMSYFVAKKLGTPLWDHSGGHRVEVKPMKPWRVVALTLLFFLALQLQLIVVYPYLLQASKALPPALREQYEKNPPWHLPKREVSP
jgi:uncharacterized RDD family membrane protein YckC